MNTDITPSYTFTHFFVSSLPNNFYSVTYNVPAVDFKQKRKSEKTYFIKFPRAVEASKEAMADQQRSGPQIK